MIIHGEFYDGIVGKPDLDEALEHYGIKGMKWRKHLANLKNKASLLKTKINRKLKGMSADQISYNYGQTSRPWNNSIRKDNGKANSKSLPTGNFDNDKERSHYIGNTTERFMGKRIYETGFNQREGRKYIYDVGGGKTIERANEDPDLKYGIEEGRKRVAADKKKKK